MDRNQPDLYHYESKTQITETSLQSNLSENMAQDDDNLLLTIFYNTFINPLIYVCLEDSVTVLKLICNACNNCDTEWSDYVLY